MSTQSQPEVPAHVQEYLTQHRVMTLATASRSGVPHAASMMYANHGPVLYFCTSPETTTASHIEQNPVVSFTIDDHSEDWREIRGLQGTGEVYVVLSPSAIAEVMEIFRSKFSSLTDVRARNLSVFRITPTSLHFIESERSPVEGSIQALAQDWRTTTAYNVFRELPSQQVEDIMGTMTPVRAEAGEVIVRQGAPADKFFIIADGEVEVTREDEGARKSVATLKTGQFFGEMAVLRDQPRTATVRAVKPTTLLTMPAATFRGLVAQSLSTTADINQLIETRFAELGLGRGGA